MQLIKHLENPIGALTNIHKEFPAAEVVILPPNATCLTNVGLAGLRRESMHADLVAVFSYKTLTTLMIRTGFSDFQIIPSYSLSRGDPSTAGVAAALCEGP